MKWERIGFVSLTLSLNVLDESYRSSMGFVVVMIEYFVCKEVIILVLEIDMDCCFIVLWMEMWFCLFILLNLLMRYISRSASTRASFFSINLWVIGFLCMVVVKLIVDVFLLVVYMVWFVVVCVYFKNCDFVISGFSSNNMLMSSRNRVLFLMNFFWLLNSVNVIFILIFLCLWMDGVIDFMMCWMILGLWLSFLMFSRFLFVRLFDEYKFFFCLM